MGRNLLEIGVVPFGFRLEKSSASGYLRHENGKQASVEVAARPRTRCELVLSCKSKERGGPPVKRNKSYEKNQNFASEAKQ